MHLSVWSRQQLHGPDEHPKRLNALGAAEEISVDHSDVGSTTSDLADYFFVEETLGEAISSLPAERVILLKSLIDQNEIRSAVIRILDQEGIAHN
jgi:PTS system ascorbate-specific IIB component